MMMADLLGKQVGEYRLIQFLGNGAFGDVYEGVQIYLETHVAIKLLKGSFKQEEIKKFLDEARILARLEHPHIIRILTFSVAMLDGQKLPYLAMSLAPNGVVLKRHPRGTRLPLTTIVTYVKQIASALQYAHDNKYIHRDVKPENILLGKNDELLLSDFGIAVIAHSTRSLGTPNVGGTHPYMAPEQLRGKPYPASDQYALGIIAYDQHRPLLSKRNYTSRPRSKMLYGKHLPRTGTNVLLACKSLLKRWKKRAIPSKLLVHINRPTSTQFPPLL
jgi:eukaryotic-like serine/threonine-protein kinase